MTKEELRSAMLALVNKAKEESRGLTADEQKTFDDYEAQKRAIEASEKLEEEKRNSVTLKVKGEKREFSLVKAINNVLSNRSMDDAEARMIEDGRKSFGSIAASGQIVLPTEHRALTAANAADAVAKDIARSLDPLYYADAFNALGITRMTNLRGDLSVPAYSGTTVKWQSETGAAADGTGSVTAKTFTPHRLTAKVILSKQFLLQDSAGIEAVVRRDLFTAVSHKLQSTIFGATQESNAPVALFAGVTAATAATTYADIVKMQSDLKAKKLMLDAKYLLSIEAETELMKVGVGTSTTQFGLAYNDGKVLNVPAVTTGDVAAKGVILADWREFLLCQWGGLDITVDPYTLAGNGQIQLVVNAYYDGGFRRNDSYSIAVLK